MTKYYERPEVIPTRDPFKAAWFSADNGQPFLRGSVLLSLTKTHRRRFTTIGLGESLNALVTCYSLGSEDLVAVVRCCYFSFAFR
jgi:hypothetical protein